MSSSSRAGVTGMPKVPETGLTVLYAPDQPSIEYVRTIYMRFTRWIDNI